MTLAFGSKSARNCLARLHLVTVVSVRIGGNTGICVRTDNSSSDADTTSVICNRRSTITGRSATAEIVIRSSELNVRAVSMLAAAPWRLKGSMLTGISSRRAYVIAQV